MLLGSVEFAFYLIYFFWSILAHILSTLYHSVHFKRTIAVVEVKANKPNHRFWSDTEVVEHDKRVCTESSPEERIPSQGIKPASVLISHLIFSILAPSQMQTTLSFYSSSSLPFFFLFIISLTHCHTLLTLLLEKDVSTIFFFFSQLYIA